jgi:hypothetical protein
LLMAIPGPKPKAEHRHRNRSAHEWIEVVDQPFEHPPQLRGRWPARTKQWWAAVSTMPHCALWARSDWQFALDTAIVARAFHRGDLRLGVELRRREKVMGVTADARRDLRIRYVEPTRRKSRSLSGRLRTTERRSVREDSLPSAVLPSRCGSPWEVQITPEGVQRSGAQ